MTTTKLPSVVLINILDHLPWTDISKFACDILFDAYHSIWCSDALLSLLCRRDLYCDTFQLLPPLSIPMRIYISSKLITRLQPHSCSRFAVKYSSLINHRQSIIFCYEELVRIFVEDQCHEWGKYEWGQFKEPLSNAMANAFENSKSVRIGWTKTILSHPMCIFWYHRYERHWSSYPSDGYTILDRDQYEAHCNKYKHSIYYRVSEVLSFVRDKSKVKLVKEWDSQVDWVWNAVEDDPRPNHQRAWYQYIMLFVDNVDGSAQCGLFVTTVNRPSVPSMVPRNDYRYDTADTRNHDGAFLYFDRDTPWTEFRDLFVTKHQTVQNVNEYFEFVHPPYSYQLYHNSWTDNDGKSKIDRTQNPLHCLQYFYPLLRDRYCSSCSLTS